MVGNKNWHRAATYDYFYIDEFTDYFTDKFKQLICLWINLIDYFILAYFIYIFIIQFTLLLT